MNIELGFKQLSSELLLKIAELAYPNYIGFKHPYYKEAQKSWFIDIDLDEKYKENPFYDISVCLNSKYNIHVTQKGKYLKILNQRKISKLLDKINI